MAEDQPCSDQPCRVCKKFDDPENVLLCDGCEGHYHVYCMTGCTCEYCKKRPNIFGKQPQIPEVLFLRL